MNQTMFSLFIINVLENHTTKEHPLTITEITEFVNREFALFAFEKGEEISTHAAGGDALVTVLEGTGKFTIDGKEFLLQQGESIIMPKNIPHAVYGEQRFKMLLNVVF